METTYTPIATNRPEAFRPRDFMTPSRTADENQRVLELARDRKERNGLEVKKKIEARAARAKAKKEAGIEDELGFGPDEELDEWGEKRDPNRPIKSDIAHMRRVIERGDTLSPSEIDRISDIPEARDLVRINQERIEPKGGFSLSPMKLLIRSL